MDLIKIPGRESIPLQTLLPKCTKSAAKTYTEPLNMTMEKYYINTPTRVAMFLAQLAHESGNFKWYKELWGPTERQVRYERNFAYAWPPTPTDQINRVAFSLGNYAKGDGERFMGRGAIQTTGRTNYLIVSRELRYDFVGNPEKLELPVAGTMSSGFYWYRTGLNALADKNDFKNVTKRINPGMLHYDKRLLLYQSLSKILEL